MDFGLNHRASDVLQPDKAKYKNLIACIDELFALREKAKDDGNWVLVDYLRQCLTENFEVIVEDAKRGTENESCWRFWCMVPEVLIRRFDNDLDLNEQWSN